MTDKERLFLTIQSHLDKIERLFDYPVSITLLVRTPTLKDGGVLLTRDPISVIMVEICRLLDRKPSYNIGDVVE